MYGLTASAGTQQNSLVQINHLTGAGTVVGSTGLSTIFEGDLAFNPTNGSLYGIGSISGSNVQLFQINVATGAATVIGNTPTVADYSALAFNSAGVLFAIDTGAAGNSILSIMNPLTAGIISSITMNVNLGSTAGLTFDYATGTAYVADGNGGTNLLYTLDTTTGIATSIGALGNSDIAGLAFRQTIAATVPDGGSGVALLGLGLTGLMMLQRTASRRRIA
jgi:DNA-binding beta-propeller fold protein YncE